VCLPPAPGEGCNNSSGSSAAAAVSYEEEDGAHLAAWLRGLKPARHTRWHSSVDWLASLFWEQEVEWADVCDPSFVLDHAALVRMRLEKEGHRGTILRGRAALLQRLGRARAAAGEGGGEAASASAAAAAAVGRREVDAPAGERQEPAIVRFYDAGRRPPAAAAAQPVASSLSTPQRVGGDDLVASINHDATPGFAAI
jgi:hypothetical protein